MHVTILGNPREVIERDGPEPVAEVTYTSSASPCVASQNPSLQSPRMTPDMGDVKYIQSAEDGDDIFDVCARCCMPYHYLLT